MGVVPFGLDVLKKPSIYAGFGTRHFSSNRFRNIWNSNTWLTTKPKNRIIFKATALLGAEAFYIFDKNSVLTYRQGGEKYIKWEKFS